MKNSKKIKILILILFYILTILGLLIILNKFEEGMEEEWILFQIEEIKRPEQIFCHKDMLLVKSDTVIKKLNLEERIFENFLEIEKDEIITQYQEELVFVSYKNHIISTPEENATDIKISDLNREEIFSKSYHETIKPLHIKNHSLFLIDNYLNSPERIYKIDLRDGNIEFSDIKDELTLQGDEEIEIIDSKERVLLDIPKMNDITSFCANENLNKILLLDFNGNLWVYFKKSK